MSIPNLPVNFKDDILASSNPKRKYQQTFNTDGSVSLEDVTQYKQKGSDFGAKEVNQTNTAINNIYDERILDLDELELVTEPGFFVDAQAVKEAHDSLNSKMPVCFGASETDIISFTAPYNCKVVVSFSCLGWGIDGSFLEFTIAPNKSLTKEYEHTGGCDKRNGEYMPLTASVCFSGLKRGEEYGFSRQNLYSSFGTSWHRRWSAWCIPE